MLGYGALGQYPLGSIGTVVNMVQAATVQNYYMPRPLITLTVGAETKRYSTEEVYVP